MMEGRRKAVGSGERRPFETVCHPPSSHSRTAVASSRWKHPRQSPQPGHTSGTNRSPPATSRDAGAASAEGWPPGRQGRPAGGEAKGSRPACERAFRPPTAGSDLRQASAAAASAAAANGSAGGSTGAGSKGTELGGDGREFRGAAGWRRDEAATGTRMSTAAAVVAGAGQPPAAAGMGGVGVAVAGAGAGQLPAAAGMGSFGDTGATSSHGGNTSTAMGTAQTWVGRSGVVGGVGSRRSRSRSDREDDRDGGGTTTGLKPTGSEGGGGGSMAARLRASGGVADGAGVAAAGARK